MTTETEKTPTPTPPVKVGRLTSLRGVRRELARLYVDARTGSALTPANAAKLAYVLTCCHKLIETEVIEARLIELEERTRLGNA